MPRFAAAALVALAGSAAAQNVNSILTPDTCQNLVSNGNFELDGHNGGRGYWYGVPTGWSSTTVPPTTWNGQWWAPGGGARTSSTVLVSDGNRPWGGLRSGAGRFFCALQRTGTTLSQTISGMTVGQQYTLRFLAAERPGYGNQERITVTLGGQSLLSSVNPLAGFRAHQVTFTATAASGVLTFTNAAPAAAGDSTGFIDDISICALPQTCVAVNNGDFEQNPHGVNFQYIVPAGWSRDRTNSVIALNGNGPWGGLNSGNGAYYVVLQGQGAQISQVIGGLVANRNYSVSFLAAERPGYGTNERLGLFINGNPISDSASINVWGSFVQHSYTFLASGASANITFRNTATTGGDRSVFVDEVTVCGVPPPPPPPTTVTSTTTTRTMTTATPHLSRTIDGVIGGLNSVMARVATLEQQWTGVPPLSVVVGQLSAGQQQIINQVGGIQNAIAAAVQALPPASPPASPPLGQPMPQVQVTSNGNLLLSAPGRDVQMQGSCGVLNPCDLLAALNALRSV